MNIAILGGSFDPPHFGHIQIIQHLLDKMEFDEVWVFPSYQHPFKKEQQSDFLTRLQMSHLAFDFFGKKIKICDDEKTLSGYTVDLLSHLKKKYPKFQLTFVLGSDLKEEIKFWKNPEKISQLCQLLFLPRAPKEISPFMNISSSELRKKIKAGKDVSSWIPKKLLNYILEKNLYQG